MFIQKLLSVEVMELIIIKSKLFNFKLFYGTFDNVLKCSLDQWVSKLLVK